MNEEEALWILTVGEALHNHDYAAARELAKIFKIKRKGGQNEI